MVDAVQLLFLGADGNIYGVEAPTSGNGGLPVTPVSSGGGLAPFDLEQIKGVAVVTGGVAGLMGVGGSSASGAADDASNPVKIGGVFNTAYPTLTNGQRGVVQLSPGGGIGLAIDSGTEWRNWASVPNIATTGFNIAAAGLVSIFNTTTPTLTNGQFGALQMTTRGSLRSFTTGTVSNTKTSLAVASVFAGFDTGAETSFAPLSSSPFLYNGATQDAQMSITGAVAAGTGNTAINEAPTSAAAAAIVPTATTVAASSLTLKSSAGNLYSLNVAASTAAGWALVFDATTAPADGTVQPKKAYALAIGQSVDIEFTPPLRMAVGCTVAFSTTGPFLKTASVTAFISGEMV